MPTVADEHSARLFFALWPGAAFRRALRAWCEPHLVGTSTRPVPPEQLHLTLHFLGNVERARLPALRSALCVPFRSHELRFSRCERWPGGMLAAVPDAVPAELADLKDSLGAALRRLGLPLDARAFRPHITLARRFAGPLPPDLARPLAWSVGRFALVESLAASGGYVMLRSCRAPSARGRQACGPALGLTALELAPPALGVQTWHGSCRRPVTSPLTSIFLTQTPGDPL